MSQESEYIQHKYRVAGASDGFVLLPVFILSAFLTLLSLSLVTLIRVEQIAASDAKARQQAKSNALFASRLLLAKINDQLAPHNRATATDTTTGHIRVYDATTATLLSTLGSFSETAQENEENLLHIDHNLSVSWHIDDLTSKAPVGGQVTHRVDLDYQNRRSFAQSLPAIHSFLPFALPEDRAEKYVDFLSVDQPVSTQSYSLPVDPIRGVLKTALRDTEGGHPFNNDNLQILLGSPPVLENGSYPLINRTESTGPNLHALPVLTEFVLNMGLAREEGTGNLFLCYYIFADLWNPYARRLATGDINNEFSLKISGLPKVTLSRRDVTDPEDPTQQPVSITLPDLEQYFDIYGDMNAGSVQLVTSPSATGGENGNGVHQLLLGTIPLHGTEIDLEFESSSPEIAFYNHASGTPELISTTMLKNFPPFKIECTWDEHVRRFVRVRHGNRRESMSRDSLKTPAYAFAIHFRMLDEESLGDLDYWWSAMDPRKKNFSYDLATGNGDHLEVLQDPTAVYRTNFISDLDFWSYSYSGGRRDRIARIFDLPTYRPTSIAQLSHLLVGNLPPFAIGTPNQSEINTLFDQHHLSEDLLTDNGLLPGAFNLNSTDIEAWEIFLKMAATKEWQYTHERDEATATLSTEDKHLLINHPFSAGDYLEETPDTGNYIFATEEQFSQYDKASSLHRQHPVFLQGMRIIAAHDPQFKALAKGIVHRLQARKRPFLSTSEFITSGILQKAIDEETKWNESDSGHPIPLNAPSFIRQQTFLQQMGERLTTRSDSLSVEIRTFQTSTLGSIVHSGHLLLHLQRIPANDTEGEMIITHHQWL